MLTGGSGMSGTSARSMAGQEVCSREGRSSRRMRLVPEKRTDPAEMRESNASVWMVTSTSREQKERKERVFRKLFRIVPMSQDSDRNPFAIRWAGCHRKRPLSGQTTTLMTARPGIRSGRAGRAGSASTARKGRVESGACHVKPLRNPCRYRRCCKHRFRYRRCRAERGGVGSSQ